MTTFVQYDGADGDLGKFTVPFVYLSTQHVKVTLNGFPQTHGVHYGFEGVSAIRFFPWAVPIAGTVIEIRRQSSPDSALVTYQDGTVLTAGDLNTASRQNFFLIQELIDRIDALLGGGASRLSNGQFTNAQELIDAAVASVLDSALLAELQSRISDIDSNAESILQQAARLSTVQTVIDTQLEIDGIGIGTYVLNAVETLTTDTEALAGRVALIGAEAPGGASFILDLDTVYVGPSESLAGRLSTISTALNGNSASIASEAVTRASGDDSLASLIDFLAADVGDNTAAIATEVSARATAVGAVATSVTNLTTTVGGHTSTISTQASSINGLQAQYTVKVNNNGHVSGFGLASTLNNGTPFSEFLILADRFSIVDPANSANVKVPFVVTGGVVYMQHVVIGDAIIEDLTVGKLRSGTMTATITQNADINVGTGKIIFDNGVVQLVMGSGFGSTNQFIMWYGPKVASHSLRTEANGMFYLSTSSSAYFGGTLSAGTLSTSGTTSDLAATAQVTIGPLGSNGHLIGVTYSASMIAAQFDNTAADPWGGGGTIGIALDRKVGTGTLVTVATQTLAGTAVTQDSGVGSSPRFDHSLNIGGSFTYTDNGLVAQDRTYALRMTSRQKTGGGNILAVTTQRLSVISVEQ